MGMQDRDYYREWWAKKLGYVERTPFRLSATPKKKIREWHPVLLVLLTAVICLFVFLALKFASVLARHFIG